MRRRRKPLPQAQEHALIDGLSHEGRGIAHLKGKATFLHNALPGEEVAFTYTQCKRAYDEGIANTIITPSPDREIPACPHYDVCGGCQLQHMRMSLQLANKQKMFLEQLAHFGKITLDNILPPLSGEIWGYRRKARLGVRFVEKKTPPLLVGFRERNGRFLAEIEECKVLHPLIGKRINELRLLIQQLSNYRHIPQIEVAIGGNEAALILRHMTAFSEDDLVHLQKFSEQHHIALYSQANPPASIKKLFPNDGVERLSYQLPEQKLQMLFHPTDFTQINEEINQAMIQQALALLAPAPHEAILDLFCGIGNFTLAIGRFAKEVVGVEGVASAVERAQENALHNHISNASFFVSDLSKDCSTQAWMKRRYDKILLDPSRAGADAILPMLPALGAHTIVYISCNPSTFARDAGMLVHQLGFTLKTAGIMNMFPHTAHVESIALFTKNP